MQSIIIFFGIAAILFSLYKAFEMLQKRDAKMNQQSLDKNIEWQLMDGLESLTITTLAKHSDKSRIASIVSARISDYLKMGVDPRRLYKVFENLQLNPIARHNWNEKEIELSALIQQFILQNEDSYDLMLWNEIVIGDKKSGLEKIQNSFLTKVKKNTLVWTIGEN